MIAAASPDDSVVFDLYVRGSVPKILDGTLIIAANRRNKNQAVFSRWHDSQTDLFRLDLRPGKPGRIRARVLAVDSTGRDVQAVNPFDYATQPNHGINIEGNRVWATNLLFGAPLEIDLKRWKPRRLLQYLETSRHAPQLSGTSHFAWSFDHRHAYFHQSRLEKETKTREVRAADLRLIELDTRTLREKSWEIIPPPDDAALETANFHSAFYYEENGQKFVGLLRTGARLETLAAHRNAREHTVRPMPVSTIWILNIDHRKSALQAATLEGIKQLNGLALSHLDVDASGGDGFVLFANYKQADVAEETHGANIYNEPPRNVREHYSGMTVEALNYGQVIRYERRGGKTSIRRFGRDYDPGWTSKGHSWLPINIELDHTKKRLFCSFSGFRPRLLSRHIARAYPKLTVSPARVRYVPPLLMRFDADTLKVDADPKRRHLSYAEPMAMTVVGDGAESYVCTFSPETGLRIYQAEDLSAMVCHAVAPEFMNWGETHFRPDPAHMKFTRL